MNRYFLIATAALTGSASCFLPAAPEPPGSEPVAKLYFPTTVGSKWVYDYNGKEVSEEITAVEKQDGVSIVLIRGCRQDRKMKITADGIFQVTGGPMPKHRPMQLLKLPHKDGQEWETWLGAWGGIDNTMTAHGPEKVEVPAGKYEAIRVETDFPSKVPGGLLEGKYWFAPDIGIVKQVYGENVLKLKSFTPGKK